MTAELPKALIGTPIAAPYDPWKCRDCGLQRVHPCARPHELSPCHIKECGCGDLRFATDNEIRLAEKALSLAIARHLI